MKTYIALVGLLLGSFLVPNVTQAYLTTSQSAVAVGKDTVLFTVTYKFGFLNRDVYMPILANRNREFTDTGTNAGYSILFDGKTAVTASSALATVEDANVKLNYTILPGKAKAIVLSEAEIKDGRYFLPKGKTGTFTLVALVDMSKSTIKNDVSLLMTSLPFTMVDKGKKIEARLNPSELQYYKTSEVDLKK